MKLSRCLLTLSLFFLSCDYDKSRSTIVEAMVVPRVDVTKNKSAPKKRMLAKRRKLAKGNGGSQRQQSLKRGNDPLVSLNLNLDSLAKSGLEGAAPRAQEMLQRIKALHKEGYYAAAPDTVSFNSVLNAWARADDEDAVQKASALLQTMQDELGRVEPNVVSYNTFLLILANNGKPKQAEALLRQMQADKTLRPDTITYNTVAYAWAQSRQRGAAQKAEDLLREMMALSRDGGTVKPDSVTFNTVLHAWSISSAPFKAKRAEELLEHMSRLYKAGNDDVEPDAYSFTSVIRAWATSRDKRAGKKAKNLLDRLEKLSEASGKEHLKPNFVTYTSVMTALSKCDQAGSAREAERLLDRMLERYEQGDASVKPDVISFSSVIDGWARARTPEAATKALTLLKRMKSLHQSGHEDIKPNAQTYTSVISALGKCRQSGAAEKAEELLEEMEEQFQLGDKRLEPVTICYNAVIDAYGRSPNFAKAPEAQRLLIKMEDMSEHRPNLKPDTISYNSVLLASANSFGDAGIKKGAFTIAMKSFQTVLESNDLKATSVTFALFFKAIRKLVPEGKSRDNMLKQTFGLCCESGLLNGAVWAQIKAALPEEDLKALLNATNLMVEVPESALDLPPQWMRNAGK